MFLTFLLLCFVDITYNKHRTTDDAGIPNLPYALGEPSVSYDPDQRPIVARFSDSGASHK